MSNGSDIPSPKETLTTPPPDDGEDLRDLTQPVDPDLLAVEMRPLDIDDYRRETELAEPDLGSRTQSVARATGDESDTGSTLDEPLAKLPIVDVHCHIHGMSLSKTKTSLKSFEQHGIFNGNDLSTPKKRLAYQKALSEYRQKPPEEYSSSLHSALQLGHWNFRDDPWVAKKVLDSTQAFQDATDRHELCNPVIVTPMLLDFGYTPLGTSAASKASKMKNSGNSMKESAARREEANDTGIFYFSKSARTEKDHRFFTRDKAMFEHQIEILHLMAKLWPGQIMPFCPYDPRRPDCLDHVKKAMDTQAYVGVKLYARCGWMPYYNEALHGTTVGATLDGRLDELYTYVTQNDIPILNHTSPTGHPPDGALVFPWRMTSEASANDRDEAAGGLTFGIDRYPPSNWTKPDKFVRGRTPLQKSMENMRYELTSFGYYCLYDQLTTSPYSWEPVLQMYPTLRLCFAHFGSKLGVYAHPRYNVDTQAARDDCEVLLQKNPIVAGATGHRTFRDYFKKGAIAIRDDSHAREAAESLLADGTEWGDWLSDWSAAYPDDWSTKITKLVTEYENVYTDISFITGNGTSFNDILRPIFDDALLQRAGGKRLFDKCMIGTDWYMTEIASLSPADFWGLLERAAKMDPIQFQQLDEEEQRKRTKVWEHFATKNALRYLNVKPRLGGAGMDKLKTAYGCADSKLPPWWKTLEKFYDEPEPIEPP